MSASLGAGQYVAVSPFVQLIISNGERRVVTTALLDNGCETSLITQELASVLELRGPRMQLRLRTFHGIDPALTAWITSCQISSCFDKTSSFVIPRLMAVPELRVTPRIINWPVEKRRWPHLSNLNISHFDWREVGMFIGMNVPAAFRQIKVSDKPKSKLVIECDEMWSLVFCKTIKVYIWRLIDRKTREIIGCYLGYAEKVFPGDRVWGVGCGVWEVGRINKNNLLSPISYLLSPDDRLLTTGY